MYRQITISKALNGFVVNVGCKTLVFEDKETLLSELSRYIDSPRKVELEYLKKYAPNEVDRETVETGNSLCSAIDKACGSEQIRVPAPPPF